MVCQMFENIKENLSDWSAPAVTDYVTKLLNKEAFDRSGLIYGMGHAVYTLSDPRMEVLKEYAGRLAIEKGREKEFELYNTVADAAGKLIAEKRKLNKPITPNVDFYSGFVYSMLNLPQSLYTPLFAIARIAGWSAHRIEELTNGGKIIRPAYQCVQPPRDYVPLSERK